MRAGFIHLETNPEYPDRVRLIVTDHLPDITAHEKGGDIRFIARFNDVGGARMHAHEKLKRKLIDIDAGLYRVSLAEAMAAVSTDVLNHKVVWIDPEIEKSAIEEMERLKRRNIERKQLIDYIMRIVGWLAILWLLFHFLLSLQLAG